MSSFTAIFVSKLSSMLLKKSKGVKARPRQNVIGRYYLVDPRIMRLLKYGSIFVYTL